MFVILKLSFPSILAVNHFFLFQPNTHNTSNTYINLTTQQTKIELQLINRNGVLSRSLHHYGTQQVPLKISTPLRTQTGSYQDLYTVTDPNRVLSRSLNHYGPKQVLSRSLHHYGPKQVPLKISTPLRTQTGPSQDLYTITDTNRVFYIDFDI